MAPDGHAIAPDLSPPRHLSSEAAEWWRRTIAENEFTLGDPGLVLLSAALEAFDRMREAQRQLDHLHGSVWPDQAASGHDDRAGRADGDGAAHSTVGNRPRTLETTWATRREVVMPTNRQPRNRARRSGPRDIEIRAFLLRPWHYDYIGELKEFGEARAREVWEAEREELLAEFEREYSGTFRWKSTGGKPLGWHLFEEEDPEPDEREK